MTKLQAFRAQRAAEFAVGLARPIAPPLRPASKAPDTTPFAAPQSANRARAPKGTVPLADPGSEQPLFALAVPRAAAAIGIGKTTMWRKVDAGEISARRISGTNRVVVPVDELKRYVASLPPYEPRRMKRRGVASVGEQRAS